MRTRIFKTVIALIVACTMINLPVMVKDAKASKSETMAKIVKDVKKSIEEEEKNTIEYGNGMTSHAVKPFKYSKNQKLKSERKQGTLPTKYISPYSSVKSQEQFGTCVTFANIASIESSLLKKAGYSGGLVENDPIDFSEAQLLYCAKHPDKEGGDLEGANLQYSSNDYYKRTDDGFYGYLNQMPNNYDFISFLCANKGKVFETDNPYFPDPYTNYTLPENQNNPNNWSEKKLTRYYSKARTMATKAAEKYGKSIFNLKSGERLPDINQADWVKEENDPNNGIIGDNSKIANDWKQSIINNGAMSLLLIQSQLGEYHHKTIVGDESLVNNDPYFLYPNHWIYDSEAKRIALLNYYHAVCLVGYDDNHSKYNFAAKIGESDPYDSDVADILYIKEKDGEPAFELDEKGEITNESECVSETEKEGFGRYVVPKKDGAWKVKNSYKAMINGYGKMFENGIMFISYCDKTIEQPVRYEVEESLDDILNDNKVHNDTYTYSSVRGTNLSSDTVQKEANIYSVPEGYQTDLEEIGYWTEEYNTNTKIKLYNNLNSSDDPTDGELIFEEEKDDSYCGYHTIDIPSDKKITASSGSKFSVVIEQYLPDGQRAIMTEIGNDDDVKCSRGETFIYANGEWFDVKDSPKINNKALGNLTVKVFGNKTKLKKVTIDGKKQYVRNGDTVKFTNPTGNGILDIKNKKLYDNNEEIVVTDDLDLTKISDLSISVPSVASIRIDGEADGLRFKGFVDDEDNDFVGFNGVNITYGAIITATDMYTNLFNKTLDMNLYNSWLENNGPGFICDALCTKWYRFYDGEYAAGITGMNEDNWDRTFVARGYLALHFNDGKVKYIYSDVSEPQSIRKVAKKIKDAGYPNLSENEKQIVDKYIE